MMHACDLKLAQAYLADIQECDERNAADLVKPAAAAKTFVTVAGRGAAGMTERTIRIYLVRHGETAENTHMRYLGSRDEPLNARGERQADAIATALSCVNLGGVLSSPLQRASDTAKRISTAAGVDLRLDPRLAEGSFGAWEGLTREEVLRRGASDASLLTLWESDGACAPPGGESMLSIQTRVLHFVNELARELSQDPVALVSHVGPIKALIAAALEIPLEKSRHFFLDPGTITVVDWGPHPQLRLFNSHAHLGWNSARWMN